MTVPRRSATTGAAPSSSAWASSRTWASPVSRLIGTAPARHILIPLYRAGLCDAVNIAPGRFSRPEAKYSRSVEPSPAITTSRPALVTPSA